MKRLIILILLSTETFAASTPDHFIQGFLLTAYTESATTSLDRSEIITHSIIGGVIGILPDLIGATGPHHPMDWPNYTWSHSGTNPLRFLPQYGLHLLVDHWFHRFEGDTWWPRMFGVCIVMWVGEAVLGYVLFKYVLPKL